jgi:hypothetical protein
LECRRPWKYDGFQWKEQLRLAIGTDGLRPVFQDIFGLSENNIYAAGLCFANDQNKWGIIFHYDGSSWKQVDIPKIRTNFIKIRKSNNGKLYLRGVTDEQFTESTYQLYEFDGRTLTQIKSGTQANYQFGSIIELGGKIYFINGYDLFDYANGNFIKIARLFDQPEILNVGFGRSTKDIFLGMQNGIAHYNSEDTENLVKTNENVWIRSGVVFEKDVFMMGRDSNGNNLIYHGKLNE